MIGEAVHCASLLWASEGVPGLSRIFSGIHVVRNERKRRQPCVHIRERTAKERMRERKRGRDLHGSRVESVYADADASAVVDAAAALRSSVASSAFWFSFMRTVVLSKLPMPLSPHRASMAWSSSQPDVGVVSMRSPCIFTRACGVSQRKRRAKGKRESEDAR